MLRLTLYSRLDWGSCIISIAKSASKKLEICSVKFLSHDVALYLCKSIIWPCMEYCCHVWAYAPRQLGNYYLELLDKLQSLIRRTVGPSIVAFVEPLAHC